MGTEETSQIVFSHIEGKISNKCSVRGLRWQWDLLSHGSERTIGWIKVRINRILVGSNTNTRREVPKSSRLPKRSPWRCSLSSSVLTEAEEINKMRVYTLRCMKFLRAEGRASISSAQEPRAACEINHGAGKVQKFMRTAVNKKLVESHPGCLWFFGRFPV